jgi:glycosyltransferase involved in cell wall biosynthesis
MNVKHKILQKKYPLVSIGIPVFNGEKYLKECLESILNQDYQNLEIIIGDNCSKDNTKNICEYYSKKDKRIKYYRHNTNIGAALNFNFVFKKSEGKYFKWAAHDDFCGNNYITKCVSVLENKPEIVLCYSSVVDLDENFNKIKVLNRTKGISQNPLIRLDELISWDYNCEEIFGVIRSSILRKTKLIRNYTDSDRTLLVELGLKGKFYKAQSVLLYHRNHSEMSTKTYKHWFERAKWFDPNLERRIVFPAWRQMFDYLLIVNRAPLGTKEKRRCYLEVLRRAKWRYKLFLKEILWNIKMVS